MVENVGPFLIRLVIEACLEIDIACRILGKVYFLDTSFRTQVDVLEFLISIERAATHILEYDFCLVFL